MDELPAILVFPIYGTAWAAFIWACAKAIRAVNETNDRRLPWAIAILIWYGVFFWATWSSLFVYKCVLDVFGG